MIQRFGNMFFCPLVICLTMIAAPAMGANLEARSFLKEPSSGTHFNGKLVQFTVLSCPAGPDKTLFYVPQAGEVILDAIKGTAGVPDGFSAVPSDKGMSITYTALEPIKGSRVVLKALQNKWTLKASWQDNLLLVSIPFPPGFKRPQGKTVKTLASKKPIEKLPPVTSPAPQPPPGVPGKMMPLKAGLAWHPGRNGKGLAPPQVKETRVPAVQFPGVTPLGKAYKVDMTSPPAYPVKVSFPVPASCGDRFEKLVVIKISGDKESLVIPFETDRVQRRATILCRSFSTFIPSVMGDEFDYDTGENICIDLKPAPGCEENPTDIQIQIRGEMTVGTEVRYELSRQGVGMFCPKTDFYRGNYSFENIEGSSEHFQYTSNPETLNFSSDGSNQIVSELNGPVAHGNKRNFPFMIVPENGRLEGRVTDPKGNPLAGIHVELNTAKGLLETHSGAGEKFTFENIFLEDPINQPKESIPYTLRDEELECDPVEGLFKVTGGQTLKTDVVFDGKGFIAGKITDEDGGVLDPVIVIVSPASGDNITYTGSGYYSIGNVPIGRAEVTAMCPQQNGRQAKMIDIKCAASDLDVPSTDFTLNCRDGIVFKIFDNGAFEADSDLHTLQVDTQADITLFLPRGEDQASTEATYDVNHLLRGKAGTTPSYTFTPQAYTISATVRWSVTRKMDRHSLVEYCIRREVVDRAHRDFTVQIHDKGETMAVEMRFDPEIDTALGISPETYYLKKGKKINEFPFEQSYQGTSRLGHAPGLVPGGLRGASQYRATVRILMQEQSSKPPGAERQEPAEAPAEPARNPEESSRISK